MQLIISENTVDFANRDLAPATGTPGWATDGDPAASPPVPPTQWPAWSWNMVINELLALITSAGLTPSSTNWTQLAQAIAILQPVSANDTGSANAVSITLNPVPASFAALSGRMFNITKGAAGNTGPVTLAITGVSGTIPVVTATGAAFVLGQWPAGAIGNGILTGTSFVVLNEIAPPTGLWLPIAAAATIPTGGYIPDTRSGSFTATLKASPNQYDTYQFKDALDCLGKTPMLLDPNGATINSVSGPLLCDGRVPNFTLVYDSGNYKLTF